MNNIQFVIGYVACHLVIMMTLGMLHGEHCMQWTITVSKRQPFTPCVCQCLPVMHAHMVKPDNVDTHMHSHTVLTSALQNKSSQRPWQWQPRLLLVS